MKRRMRNSKSPHRNHGGKSGEYLQNKQIRDASDLTRTK